LAPPSPRAVIARILRNLKGSYLERKDFVHALAAIERIILVEGESLNEIRDRGLLQSRLGRIHVALMDLDTYIRGTSEAADLDTIRHHALRLIRQIGMRS
jgi:regulator of sirC expression with transglutaminase-like and TPR domain